MSIFNLFENIPLKGDKSKRFLKSDVLEYEHFKQDDVGEKIFEIKRGILWVPYLVCLITLGILVGQLVRLQITEGSFHRILAEGNRVRVREIKAPRGLIYDSKGVVLAKNQPSFNLEIYPLDLPRNAEERNEIFKKLSTIAQISEVDISEKVLKKGFSTYDPVILKENIDRETALILEVRTANLSGVAVAKIPVREYNNIEGLGPILGYVGKMTNEDLQKNPLYKTFYDIGKDGLEFNYEKYLKGIPGISEIEVDSHGRQQRQLAVSDPQPGNNLTLSLDSALEIQLTKALERAVYRANSLAGVAVVLNPQNGQILAITSVPSFDNNLFTRQTAGEEYQKLLDDPSKPMFNRAISGTYPSGSTIKPVIAAAGLEDGTITVNTTINDPGEIKVGSYTYPDWKAHGLVDVRKAIAESCNVFFYSVAGGWDKIKGLGIGKLDDYLKRFGFGSKLGVDLPGEVSGLVPDPAWKEKNKKEMWYLGDTYHLGIGQGDFLVTPLQMAAAYGVIANNGELLVPQIASKITDKDGNVIWQSNKEIIRKDFIAKENLQIVREGMRQAVTTGSAKLLADLPVMAAAKTGTAQFGNEGKTHGWMAAFAPYHDPQIVIIVLVEAGSEGYASAGPVINETLNWYFSR